MRILFMGTDEFAIPSLYKLFSSNHDLVGVITQPDRPSGRGRKLKASPIKKLSNKLSIPLYQPKRVSGTDFIEKVQKLKPELIVVVAYGQILKEDLLCCPTVACINVHPSLLPKYRGAAPIQRAIINGEKQTGVTIMLMDEGEDTGDIITQKTVMVGSDDTSITLKDRLSKVAADMLLEVVEQAQKKGELSHVPQDHDKATHAPKLTKEEGEINWSKSAREIYNLFRGTQPWPGVYTYYGGNSVKITSCEVSPENDSDEIQPGTIIVRSGKFEVATGDGKLVINELQPANKRKIDANDFINGYRLKTGARFGKG